MSMITEQVKAIEEHADYMQKIGHLFTASILKRAADTIEQLSAKVREDNAYQKAFEDIRADIERYEADCILAADSKECKECDKIVFGSIYHIIDKHNPDKVGKEGLDAL